MRDAGMIGILLEQRIENGDSFFQVGGGVDVFFGKGDKRKRVEGANFAVARIFGVKPFEGGGIGFRTVGMGHLGFFLKEGGGSSDEAFFPRVDGAEFLCLFYVFMAFLECFVIRKIPKLLVQSKRSAPVGPGALRIARRGFGKRLFGFLVLEGVQESDTLFDGWLTSAAQVVGKFTLPS